MTRKYVKREPWKKVKCQCGVEQAVAQRCSACGRYLITPLDEIERKAIIRAIFITRNANQAARYLNIAEGTLRSRLIKYGVSVRAIRKGQQQ